MKKIFLLFALLGCLVSQVVSAEVLDIKTKIVGKWEYVSTELRLGNETMRTKTVPAWTMEYKKDGTFSEVQRLGDKDYSKDAGFTVKDKILQREGLVPIEITKLNDTELVFTAVGAKQIFKKIK